MMHVLRIWLTTGAQVELLYRGKGDARAARHKLEEPAANMVCLADDFGKETWVALPHIAGWQVSDYEAELVGALEIARAKQQASDAHQRSVMASRGVIGQGLSGLPGNGKVIMG